MSMYRQLLCLFGRHRFRRTDTRCIVTEREVPKAWFYLIQDTCCHCGYQWRTWFHQSACEKKDEAGRVFLGGTAKAEWCEEMNERYGEDEIPNEQE